MFSPNDESLKTDSIIKILYKYQGYYHDVENNIILTGPEMYENSLKVCHLINNIQQVKGIILLAVSNGPMFPSALIGILMAGMYPLLIHSATPILELHRFCIKYGCTHILSNTIKLSKISYETDKVIEFGSIGYFILRQIKSHSFQELSLNFYLSLHQTSGTTGAPKIAIRKFIASIAEAQNYSHTLSVTDKDTIFCTTPMSHSYAYGIGVILPLLTGANCITLNTFNPRMINNILSYDEVSILSVVPAMLPVIIKYGWRTVKKKKLRMILTAGSKLPHQISKLCFEKTGYIPYSLLGTTETGGISISSGIISDNSVGRVMDGVEVTVQEHNKKTGIGNLLVRSNSMMYGYLSHPPSEGWFITGDLAKLDESNHLYLYGRTSEVINILGYKVIPQEVESVLGLYKDIIDIKVYSGLHRHGIAAVYAAIVCNKNIKEEDIHTICRESLIFYKRPTRIFLLDSLPRNASGKVIISKLPYSFIPQDLLLK